MTGRARILHLLLAFFFAVLGSSQLTAQSSILIFPPDVSGFPEVATSFYPFDKDGVPFDSITEGMVSLFEDGVEVEPTLFTCPEKFDPRPASVVLAIDISGSMGIHVGNDIDSDIVLDRVADAVRTFIRGLDLSTSEVSLTTFNTRSRVVAPFTRDSSFLFDRLDQLTAGEGTDYREAFIGAAGAINVVRGGRHRRVVVMFTDGEGINGESDEIIAEARAAGATVYVVVVGPYPRDILGEIADGTGGIYYNVYHRYDVLARLARMLVGHARQETPCRIEWMGRPGCDIDRRVLLRIPLHNIWGDTRYQTPRIPVPEATVLPDGIRLNARPPGKDTTISVRVEAETGTITLLAIESSHPAISIDEMTGDPGFLPREIERGEGLDLTLRYSGSSDTYVDARIVFTSNGCTPDTLFLTAGSPIDRGDLPGLSIVAPNGGERFPVASRGAIRYTGGVRTLPYRLSITTDWGMTWEELGESGGVDPFALTFPETPSDSCLARVMQRTTVDESIIVPVGGDVHDLEFSADGSVLFVLVDGGKVLRLDAGTGALVSELDFGVEATEFTLVQGLDAVAAEYQGSVYVAYSDPSRTTDVYPGRLLPVPETGGVMTWGDRDGRIAPHPSRPIIYGVRFAPDGAGETVPVLYRRDVASDDYLAIDTISCIARAVAYTPNGPYLAVGGVDGCYEIRVGEETVRHTGADPYGDIVSMTFDESGTWLLFLFRDDDRGSYSMVVRHSLSGTIAAQYPDIAAEVRSVEFAGSADAFVLGERWPTIRSTSTGEITRRFERVEPGGGGATFDQEGERVAISTADRGVQIWHLDQPYDLVDVSDSLWSIIPPGLSLLDVDFGTRLVGSPVDSTIDALVKNVGEYPLSIDSLAIDGIHSRDFRILSGVADTILIPGESVPVSLRFTPGGVGRREATFDVYSYGLPYSAGLTGEGVLPRLRIVDLDANSLDFGAWSVGTLVDSAVTLENRGDIPLRVDEVSLVGPDGQDFGVDLSDLPLTILPGERQSLTVRFAPLKEGLRYTEGEVLFVDAVSGTLDRASPLRFHLWGRGFGAEDPAGALTDTLLTVETECLAPDTLSTVFQNHGADDLLLDSPGFTVGSPLRFVPGTFPMTVSAGEEAELVILFEPSDVGSWRESIDIITSGPRTDTLALIFEAASLSASFDVNVVTVFDDHYCDEDRLTLDLEISLEGEGVVNAEYDVLPERGSGVVISGAPGVARLQAGEPFRLRIELEPAEGVDTLRGQVVVSDIPCSDPIVVPFESIRRPHSMSIVPIDSICAGESLVLEVRGEGTVLWEENVDIACRECVVQEVTPSESGWYRVELVDRFGCRTRDSVEISIRRSLRGDLLFPLNLSLAIDDTISIPLVFSHRGGRAEGVKSMRLQIDYDPTVLLPLSDLEENFSGTLLDSWGVDRIERRTGSVVWHVSGPQVTIDRNVTLMRLMGRSFIGGGRGTELRGSVEFDTHCTEIAPAREWVAVDSICGLDERLIETAFGRWRGPSVEPNPVRIGPVSIRFEIPFASVVIMEITDVTGRIVTSLYHGILHEGTHRVVWNAGESAAGLYYLRMEAGGHLFLTPVRLLE